ncbi:iron-only hydrogenase system regulator [Pseudoflavonifractor sp. DSM 107456]|uniref:Iron-only hydrogenase system regulator n=2 Tax=Pseudoflavonifractor TaxID=1017280 RepID=A0ABR9R9C4_9FIRM|nr:MULTISPECIES: TM1266 family iron-only hydrogenase system putative regulator [Eubacteriales]MBC5731089.1 iron-only hydrogenase system regulator [Pseudoflavonifractor hominis]MBE5055299.1 iron-only hydrogenase system regulator [Pseudoflavonifractor gallinarum]MBT9684911.1 iron-only hydrogenase system regulator [Pseudoflavonifractor sp. MCC625]
MEESRVALLGVVVENADSVEKLNELLHQYKDYIIGRMGLPYRQRGCNIISIVLDAPSDAISALSGKVGMLPGVTCKAIYSKLPNG